MTALLQARPAMTIAYFTAADGVRLRTAHWPAEGSAETLLLLPGRAEHLEKYSELAADLNQRGYAVRGLEWRGQGLSGRLLPDRQRGHVRRFSDYVDDLIAWVESLPLSGAMIVLGHSMGGAIALDLVLRRPDLVQAAILSSPMFGIGGVSMPLWFVRLAARLACSLGFADRFAPGQKPYAARRQPFEGNPLTSDPKRYQERIRQWEDEPALQLGGVTWGWLDATFRAEAARARPGLLEAVATPTLMLQAEHEKLVDNRTMTKVCARMPNCRLVRFDGALHEMLMERDEIRVQALALIDRFLGEHTRRNG